MYQRNELPCFFRVSVTCSGIQCSLLCNNSATITAQVAYRHHHLSNDDSLVNNRNNRKKISFKTVLYCVVLCTTVVHNDTRTQCEQFLKMSVGLG